MASYEEKISRGLDRAYGQAQRLPVELATLRAVVFSDHHKGVGDGADDFRACKATYEGALQHYRQQAGWTLMLLGDAEELWENRAKPVISWNESTLRLEAGFQPSLEKFFGNHDDEWAYPDSVTRELGGIFQFPQGRGVREGLVLEIQNSGNHLGDIFLVHGHQGDSVSDRNPLSRWFVRQVWRRVQRVTGIKLSTPSKDPELRDRHGFAMYGWVAGKGKHLMIAGHTHAPVFESVSPAQVAQQQKSTLGAPAWVQHEVAVKSVAPGTGRKPCYFNSGCCSYKDGTITGIELADGQVRLVDWRLDGGSAVRRQWRQADLTAVFSAL